MKQTQVATMAPMVTAGKIMAREDETLATLRTELAEIELGVLTSYTLADAIREGSGATDQAYGWGNGKTACALSAGYLAAKARGYIG